MALYTIDRPQPGDFPSDSQPQLRDNSNYLMNSVGAGLLKDHNMTGDSSNTSTVPSDGIHKQVTLYNHATPGFTGGNSVLYANLANTASQLFLDNTTNAQLTVVKAANAVNPGDAAVPSDTVTVSPANKGVSFLAGGFLIQWGTTGPGLIGNGVTTTFPVAFSGVPFSVVITPKNAITPPSTWSVLGATATGWTYGKSSGADIVSWVAIGPA